MELREFEKGDWYAWAGCVPFPDGSPPFAGDFTDEEVEGRMEVTISVVFDGTGSNAFVEESEDLYILDSELTPEKARQVASQIHCVVDLRKLGYKLYSGEEEPC